ncbi:MAG TPA: four helix bundle protein [Armatimonadota bacterium]|nr:four helix bundle protein [Armatimonadota bacterium]
MAESFQELEVWRVSMDLAVDIADLVEQFHHDYRWLAQQMMRSSESGPSNIAEGFERQLDGDFGRFLRIAKASTGETESHLVYALRRRLITNEEQKEFADRCIHVKKMLNSLGSYLRKKGK